MIHKRTFLARNHIKKDAINLLIGESSLNIRNVYEIYKTIIFPETVMFLSY